MTGVGVDVADSGIDQSAATARSGMASFAGLTFNNGAGSGGGLSLPALIVAGVLLMFVLKKAK